MQQFASPDGAELQLWQSLSVEQDEGHPLLFPDELPEELPPLLLPLPLLLLLALLLPLSSPVVASVAPPEVLPGVGPKPVGAVCELDPPHAINTAMADRQRGVMIRFATLMLDSSCPATATLPAHLASHMPSLWGHKHWANSLSARPYAQIAQ
jgi:hypothetical protein